MDILSIILVIILIITPGLVFGLIICKEERDLDKEGWIKPIKKPKPFRRVILLHLVDGELKESYGHWSPNNGWVMIDNVGRYIAINKIRRWRESI